MQGERPRKIVLLGDSGVGKTSLLTKWTKDVFTPNTPQTLASQFVTKTVEINFRAYQLNLWDTAGQERYFEISKLTVHDASAALLIFDMTCETSFRQLNRWADYLRDNAPDIALAVVGNKVDQDTDRQVTWDSAREYADSLACDYFETSAITSFGVDEAFMAIAEKAIAKAVPQAGAGEHIDIGQAKPDTETEAKQCCS
jgi:small GTP-binding protein